VVDQLLPMTGIVHCRIWIEHDAERLVIHLAGRLSEAEVPELLQACASGQPTVLELDELVSADAIGIDALMRIERSGSRLVGLPHYVRLKMDVLAREDGRDR
jgi:hypothetical protein